MPGVSDETLAALEANIQAMGRFTDNLRSVSLLEVMKRATKGLGFVAAPQAQAAQFQCRCSRERAVASLTYFGMQERQSMMNDGAGSGVPLVQRALPDHPWRDRRPRLAGSARTGLKRSETGLSVRPVCDHITLQSKAGSTIQT